MDLCGSGSVCGVDGTTYGDYCAAGSAGVEVDYAGPCVDGCADVTCDLACAYGLATDAEGCPRCECAPPPPCTDDAPCADGYACVAGRCQPRDGGLPTDSGRDAGSPDTGPGDSGPRDSGAMDARACPVGMRFCHDACTPLGTVTDCTDCGDACTLVDPTDPSRMNVCTPTGCRVACRDGYADCDGDLSNGCESIHSERFCGGCDTSCRFGDCSTGTCVCGDGLTFCGGACVDTTTNAQHCGRCDNPCDPGEGCVAGTCLSEGDPCTNPANWTCTMSPTGCMATCGTNSFSFGILPGSFCEADGRVDCMPPRPGPGGLVDCEACQMEAALCCTGGE